ncbi:MAG: hypothetical protein IJ196_00905 [Prevotella sp.]|nr:hypothetical protein [Prevotella sp.]
MRQDKRTYIQPQTATLSTEPAQAFMAGSDEMDSIFNGRVDGKIEISDGGDDLEGLEADAKPFIVLHDVWED